MGRRIDPCSTTLVSEFGIGTAVVTLRDLSEEQLQQLNMLSVALGIDLALRMRIS
jgi:hypothetical protein